MRKLVLSVLIVCMVLLGGSTVFAGSWKKDHIGWWYEEGYSYVRSDWRKIKGKWYFFHVDGYMAYNTWIGNYYLGKDGDMLVNTYTPDNFYVDHNGVWDGKPANLNARYESLYKPFFDALKKQIRNPGSVPDTDEYYLIQHHPDNHGYIEGFKVSEYGYDLRDLNDDGSMELVVLHNQKAYLGNVANNTVAIVALDKANRPEVILQGHYGRAGLEILTDNRIFFAFPSLVSLNRLDKNNNLITLEESDWHTPLKTRGDASEDKFIFHPLP